MEQESEKVGELVRINQEKIPAEVRELVRGTVEETMIGLLDAEAYAFCKAGRYERSDDHNYTRPGITPASGLTLAIIGLAGGVVKHTA